VSKPNIASQEGVHLRSLEATSMKAALAARIVVGQDIGHVDAAGNLVSKQDLGQESMIIGIDHAPDGGSIAAGEKYEAVWVLKLDTAGNRDVSTGQNR
jgi:hypothetical protein